jgi:hypothetical protein
LHPIPLEPDVRKRLCFFSQARTAGPAKPVSGLRPFSALVTVNFSSIALFITNTMSLARAAFPLTGLPKVQSPGQDQQNSQPAQDVRQIIAQGDTPFGVFVHNPGFEGLV